MYPPTFLVRGQSGGGGGGGGWGGGGGGGGTLLQYWKSFHMTS